MYYKRPQWVSNTSVYTYLYIFQVHPQCISYSIGLACIYTVPQHKPVIMRLYTLWYSSGITWHTVNALGSIFCKHMLFDLASFLVCLNLADLKLYFFLSLLVTKMLHYDSQAKAFMSNEYDTIWLVIKCHSDLMTQLSNTSTPVTTSAHLLYIQSL